MSERRWREVDAYFGAIVQEDAALQAALAESAKAGLPAIAVSPAQGKLLALIARSIGAKRVLEIGALGGYSTIWLARALPSGGRVVTLEINPRHAEIARANLARAGLTDKVEVLVGPALDLLPALPGPFDLAFIDADKESNADYFAHALRLSRPGSVIIVDNVVRNGRVLDVPGDAQVEGVRRMIDLVADEPRVSATAIQTVGEKGYDGFLMAVVR
ncbi:MAG: O-methyltransferase [Hydrogenophilaceae bacterium]|jgi:predicted O-methyltransferase YrrM|nr:O-methyltransferase [Hydrogenophilaceae bacterium]